MAFLYLLEYLLCMRTRDESEIYHGLALWGGGHLYNCKEMLDVEEPPFSLEQESYCKLFNHTHTLVV